jgi:hypothetical protein
VDGHCDTPCLPHGLCPPVALVRAAAGRLPASRLYDLIRSHVSTLRPDYEELGSTVSGSALPIVSIELVRALVAMAAEPDTAHGAAALALERAAELSPDREPWTRRLVSAATIAVPSGQADCRWRLATLPSPC